MLLLKNNFYQFFKFLYHIFFRLNDSNASLEWAIEGRRMVPLIPRLVPQTSYLQIANQAAMEALQQNRAIQLAEEAKSNGKVVKGELFLHFHGIWH